MDTKTKDNVRRKKKTCKTNIPQKNKVKILNKILANQIQENKRQALFSPFSQFLE